MRTPYAPCLTQYTWGGTSVGALRLRTYHPAALQSYNSRFANAFAYCLPERERIITIVLDKEWPPFSR